jgi:DNA-directed RNA polymerase beta subunit
MSKFKNYSEKNLKFLLRRIRQDVDPFEMSYAFKLLADEIQSLHIKTKLNLKNKYE